MSLLPTAEWAVIELLNGLILGTLHCIRVKLLNIFVVSLLQVVPCPCALACQPAVHRDQCYLSSSEDSSFWWKWSCSSMSSLLRSERGIVCVLTRFHLWVIDLGSLNLWIYFQLYWTQREQRTEAYIIIGGNPDFYKLHPHFGKFHDIECFTVDSIFIIQFHNSVSVFCIAEIIGP